MSRTFHVSLSGAFVGYLSEDDRGRISFRFAEEYRRMPRRPVLSQSFEDDLAKIYRGKQNELPAYFGNLVPEGSLRALIESSLQLPHGDDLALLEAVGEDLPGAVEIHAGPGEPESSAGDENGEREIAPPDAESDEAVLRFSLAGVQLKFSVLRENEKLTLPAHGGLGDWIVKLDSSRFPHVVENEFATLEWARRAGFEVPECHLQPLSSLPPALRGYSAAEANVFVIRRYDRDGDRRIHQEDFAQVASLPPRRKYDQLTYEQCAVLARQIAGEEVYFEFVRRLAFVIACGNTDAHLKNWSLIYPDGIRARLSPLYDQVCTIVWPELPAELALKLAGVKQILQVDEQAFARLARRAAADSKQTLSTLHDSLERIGLAWAESGAGEIMPDEHVRALRAYWLKAPLLRLHRAAFQL